MSKIANGETCRLSSGIPSIRKRFSKNHALLRNILRNRTRQTLILGRNSVNGAKNTHKNGRSGSKNTEVLFRMLPSMYLMTKTNVIRSKESRADTISSSGESHTLEKSKSVHWSTQIKTSLATTTTSMMKIMSITATTIKTMTTKTRTMKTATSSISQEKLIQWST